MVAAEHAIHRDARNRANDQPNQNLCMKRHAFRLVGRLFVEVGGYFTFKCVAL